MISESLGNLKTRAFFTKVAENSVYGNDTYAMTDHYIKPSEEDLQTAMDRYTRWFDGKAAGSVGQGVDPTIDNIDIIE